MFKIEMTDSSQIAVHTRKYTYNYSIDGSLANPLEATYAALAGCTGVYVLKAARKLGKSSVGIQIQCRSIVKPENPSVTAKWITEVYFPPEWHAEEKAVILSAIKNCAVKELIQNGSAIEFITEEKIEAK